MCAPVCMQSGTNIRIFTQTLLCNSRVNTHLLFEADVVVHGVGGGGGWAYTQLFMTHTGTLELILSLLPRGAGSRFEVGRPWVVRGVVGPKGALIPGSSPGKS